MPIVKAPDILGGMQQGIAMRGQVLKQRAMQEEMGRAEEMHPMQMKRQQLLAQQQQQAIEEFTDKTKLRSMARGASDILRIKDPAERKAYLDNRLQEIIQRGGNPAQTLEMMDLPFEEQDAAAQNVMTMAEREGVWKPVAQPKPGKLYEGFVDEEPAFLKEVDGKMVKVPGAAPELKKDKAAKGEGVSKGAATALQKGLVKDKKMLQSAGNLLKDYSKEYLTLWGRIKTSGAGWGSMVNFPIWEKHGRGATRFISQVSDLFNQYRHAITGAQASIKELEHLRVAMMNEKDNPLKFEEKAKVFVKKMQQTIALKEKVLKEGLYDPNDKESIGRAIDRLKAEGYGFDPGGVGADWSADAAGAAVSTDPNVRAQELAEQGLDKDEILDKLEEEGF